MTTRHIKSHKQRERSIAIINEFISNLKKNMKKYPEKGDKKRLGHLKYRKRKYRKLKLK